MINIYLFIYLFTYLVIKILFISAQPWTVGGPRLECAHSHSLLQLFYHTHNIFASFILLPISI
jgi:hypothetical protein